MIVGWLLAVFQLPGTWFILLATAVYDWHFAWKPIAWQLLVIMVLLAVERPPAVQLRMFALILVRAAGALGQLCPRQRRIIGEYDCREREQHSAQTKCGSH